MVGRSGYSTAAGTLPGWSLLFAREPVSDGDPGQTDMDKTVVLGAPGKKPDSKPPLRQRILFLLLLMTFAVVGGYFAMHPEMLMTLLGGAPPHVSPVTPIQKTPNPLPPPIPAPVPNSSSSITDTTPSAASAASPTPATGGSAVPVPVKPDIPLPPPTIPVPVSGTPAPSTSPALPAQTPKPPIPVPVPVPTPMPVTAVIPSPHFHEGQKVSVTAQTSLTTDAAGTKPGPPVRFGSMLTVLDADLQQNTWVYSVKTETGSMGWISEKNLKLK